MRPARARARSSAIVLAAAAAAAAALGPRVARAQDAQPPPGAPPTQQPAPQPAAQPASTTPEADPNVTALARAEFDEGVQAARAQRWTEALARFQRAYALTHRVQVLMNVASALVQTGHMVEGAEAYRRFLREAPEALVELRAAASAALADVVARTPHARLDVRPRLAADRYALDGATLPPAALGAALPLDVGRHALRVVRGRATVAERAFVLSERESLAIVLAVPPLERPVPLVRSAAFWGVVGGVVLAAAAAVIVGTAVYYGTAPAPYAGNVPPGTVTVQP